MYEIAKVTATRPSEILGLRNTWVAYCFDRGIVSFGRYTESKLSLRDKKGKPRYRLEQLLADPPKPGERKVMSMQQMMALGVPVKVKMPEAIH